MNKYLAAVRFACLAICGSLANFYQSADAQDTSAAKPLWELGVAAGTASLPAYIGAQENVTRSLVLPMFIYRGEIFRADRDTAGARFVKTRDYEIDLGFGGSLGASNTDVPARVGMPSLGGTLEFGPRLKFTLARPNPDSKLTLSLPLRTVLEFKGGIKQRGLVLEPGLSFDQRDAFAGWGLNASASVLLGDAKLQNYLYGVAPAYATGTRNAFAAKSGLMATRLSLSSSKSISRDATVAIFARWESAGVGANTSSPLHLKNNGFSVGVGFTYTFFRSASMVREAGE
jgi:MipA family protein